MNNPNLSLGIQEFRGDGCRVVCPTKSSFNQPELDPQVAAVLEAANGCTYTAVKVAKALILALRPLDSSGTPPTFPPLKLIDSYLATCSTALLNNLKAASVELEELNINLIKTDDGFESSVSTLKVGRAMDPKVACLEAAAKLHTLAKRFETLATQDNPIYCESTIKRINLQCTTPAQCDG